MKDPKANRPVRRTIVVILNPDGTRHAMESLAYPPVGDEVQVTDLPRTARVLPLSPEEAEEWVNDVMADSDEESRQHWISLLSNVEPS